MKVFLDELRQTLLPGRDPKQGPLPPLLVSLTVVTGLVDAFSYLVLGHVFVANMTGNVVFLGFAVAGAPGFSIVSSLVALAAFAFGAGLGGRFIAAFSQHRGRLLAVASLVQVALLALGVVVAVAERLALHAGLRDLLIVALAGAMGLQNAAARKLAVPDLTTTVLTLTITGIVADSALLGGAGAKTGRRLISIVAMLLGALVGALLVIHAASYVPLIVALAIIALVAGIAVRSGRSTEAWTSG